MTAKRGHNPSQSVDDVYTFGRIFSIETADKIVEAVRLTPLLDPDDCNPEIEASPDDMVSAQLARRLNDASQWWAWNERQQTSASPAKRAERADQIAAKCAGLLASMRGPDGELLDSLGAGGLWAQAALGGAESGRNAVSSALSAIEELQGWALAMAARDGRHIRHTRGPGRPTDEAFNSLIATLGGIFLLFWRRLPRLSRDPLNGGAPGGPFFRFVSAVLYEMDDARSDEVIASAIRHNPTLKALRTMEK
jgi:hypothetical protein